MSTWITCDACKSSWSRPHSNPPCPFCHLDASAAEVARLREALEKVIEEVAEITKAPST